MRIGKLVDGIVNKVLDTLLDESSEVVSELVNDLEQINNIDLTFQDIQDAKQNVLTTTSDSTFFENWSKKFLQYLLNEK